MGNSDAVGKAEETHVSDCSCCFSLVRRIEKI